MKIFLRPISASLLILSVAMATRAFASADPSSASTSAVQLAPVTVTADASPASTSGPASPPTQYQLPQPIQTVTADQIADTVNAVDVEDALKYEPSLFIRKRNYGDTQPTVATRTWGVNSSARSLVYADGILLSALIANNNTLGAPRWGMVSPEEIDHIDILYGPYSAAYPGNSMGSVIEITTRMPDSPVASVTQTEALQSFSLYSTNGNYLSSQTQAVAGDRVGKLSVLVTASFSDTHSQPLMFVTAGSLPAGTTGGIDAQNKLGASADVLGASGLLDSTFATAKLKASYDITPALTATYTIGVWTNDTTSTVQTYLRNASDDATYAGASGFASGTYYLDEQHIMQSLVLRSTGVGDWDWQIIGTDYYFDQDTQRSPSTASATGATFSNNGTVADLSGTGWATLDLKAAWHPDGPAGTQELSFGAHADQYTLVDPTYNTPDWRSGDPAYSSIYTEGNGKTRTLALWAQEAWQFAPRFKLTLGARLENWRAYDGINISNGATVIQPTATSTNVSPKATLEWKPAPAWTIASSFGEAYRYPTVGELYQIVSSGTTLAQPDGNLSPEQDLSGELRFQRNWSQGFARLTFFQENVFNAIVSQTNINASNQAVSYNQNVGELRNRGIELVADQNDILIRGLELTGSVTYVDSDILSDPAYPAAVGKRAPYVPDWRATLAATYHPTKTLAFTLAARYSGRQYSTLNNADTVGNVMGAFDDFFVLDAHVNWHVTPRLALSGGIDNILNEKYFLYHPFPQRTFVAEVNLSL